MNTDEHKFLYKEEMFLKNKKTICENPCLSVVKKRKPPMNTDEHKFLYKEETHQIIGCSFEVLNTLGHGLLEKPYENALCVEFNLKQILNILS